MVEQVSAWRAADGKLYYRKVEAAKAEAAVVVREVLGNGITEANLQQILEHAAPLHEALGTLAEAQKESAKGAVGVLMASPEDAILAGDTN